MTSTYFGANPPFDEGDKRRFGHSRDRRSDCVQVVIALVVTPQGSPLAYEVLPGNTEPERELKLLLERLRVELPAQPPPGISANQVDAASSV